MQGNYEAGLKLERAMCEGVLWLTHSGLVWARVDKVSFVLGGAHASRDVFACQLKKECFQYRELMAVHRLHRYNIPHATVAVGPQVGWICRGCVER